MAHTIRTNIGTGSPTVYDVDFDLGYLSQSHIHVYQGEDYRQNLVEFTWVNAGQIQCEVPALEEFFIRRVVPRHVPINDYEDGAILRESNLDASFAQSLMILEEISDGYIDPINKDIRVEDLNMGGYKILNLANGTELSEAVNLQQLLEISGVEERPPIYHPRVVGDGVQTVFSTEATEQASALNFWIHLDGVKQRPLTDYSINGTGDVVFEEAPPRNVVVDIVWFQPLVFSNKLDGQFETIDEALTSNNLAVGSELHIKELITPDKTLYLWDVVEASTVTPNLWNKRVSSVNPLLAIVCRNTEDYIFNLSKGDMEIIAHRGFALSAPENTMLSMSSAADHGADSLEMDIQTSLDGTAWAYHDPDLSSDTNLSGPISSSTDAYIETGVFNALVGTRFASLGLSKFEDMLKFASARSLKIYPEMKFTGWTEPAMDALLALLDDYNYLNENCMIQAVDTTLLEYVRSKNKDVLLAHAQQGNFASAQPAIDLMESLGNGGIVWDHTNLLAEPELFFPYCFDRGVRITAFTVRDSKLARDLKRLGCNGIITDSILRGNS